GRIEQRAARSADADLLYLHRRTRRADRGTAPVVPGTGLPAIPDAGDLQDARKGLRRRPLLIEQGMDLRAREIHRHQVVAEGLDPNHLAPGAGARVESADAADAARVHERERGAGAYALRVRNEITHR